MIRKNHIFGLLFLLMGISSFAQSNPKEIVQVTGIIHAMDQNYTVPYATILVKNKDRGTNSNENGFFSMPCIKGDTLQVSAVGFRNKEYILPETIEGSFYNLTVQLIQDTFYLPETIIRPIPEDFDYAFKYWDIAEDKYTVAERNTNRQTIRRLLYSMPKSGAENQSYMQMQNAQSTYYYGQQKPMNILNPLKWMEFIDSWKRGDFRKKN